MWCYNLYNKYILIVLIKITATNKRNLGLVWAEIKSLWYGGLLEYISDLWNIVDFITNFFYITWLALRMSAFYVVWV